MQFAKTHLYGSFISTVHFLLFFFLFAMAIDGDIYVVAGLPFIFLYAFPIYLLIANPITLFFRQILRKTTKHYLLYLIMILMVFSFLINSLFSYLTGGVALDNYAQIFIWVYITAFPALLGVERSFGD